MGETSTMRLTDGRELASCQWGPDDGRPLFLLHGTPGGRLLRHVHGEYDRLGLRVITYDRPGYGRSSRLPGRPIRQAAGDVTALADHLGVESFGVLGVSAGGAYALAVAALLPHRVACCATIIAGAPFGAQGLDWFAGMPERTREQVQAALARGEAVQLERYERCLRFVDELSGELSLARAERDMLTSAFHDGVSSGPWGVIDDGLAEFGSWDVDVSLITAPTRIMLARDDPETPAAHAEWLMRHLPLAKVTWVDGDHMDPRQEEVEELLCWMSENI